MAKAIKHRHIEIDLLRSCAIVGMVMYHGAFDLAYFYGWEIDVFSGAWMLLARSTACLFLVLVGVSFVLSVKEKSSQELWNKSIKRAGVILTNALLISIVTYLLDPQTYIRFGILHLIGISALALPFFRHCKQWNVIIGIAVILAGLAIKGTVVSTSLLIPFGMVPPSFATLDYFPLFPWFGVILIGMAAGTAVYQDRTVETQRRCVSAGIWHILALPGRHALLIYMVHQIVMMGLLWLFL